jgi:hypothetical protein
MAAIHSMDLWKYIHVEEIDQVKNISQLFNIFSEAVYSIERELLFADNLVNG